MLMKDIFHKYAFKIALVIEILLLGIIILVKLLPPLESYTVPVMSGTPDIGEIYDEGGYYTFDQDEDARRALELDDYIPFHISMPVKAGSYTVVVDYKSSSYSNLRLFSSSDQYAVQCDDFMLYENKEQLTSNIIVKYDVSDMDFCVKYGGYGWFDIRGITLQENHRDVLPLVLKLIALFLFIDFLIILNKRNITFAESKKLRVCFALISFALIASLPMFVGFLPTMDDIGFSTVRIEGIKDAILEGQIPAIVVPNSLMGYGYADPVFYPNILLYFPAIMRVIGFTFMESYKTFIFLIHLLTAGIAYYTVRRTFHSAKIGLIGSFIYTFSIYRLIDVYRRCALGEFCAMAFLPLIVYGMYRILTENTDDENYKKSWIPFTIGLWGVANTHLLSCEMVAVFIIPVCLVCIRRVFTKARLLQLLKSIGVTVLLTMYFIVPFIDMSLRDSYKVYTREPFDVAEGAISLFQVFALFCSQVGSAVGFTNGNPPRDIGIGFVFLLGILLFIYLYGRTKNRKTDEIDNIVHRRFILLCCILGCIAIWMTTYHFPWSQIGYMGGLLKQILFMVQFPWRYISIATVLLLFVLCAVVRWLLNLSDKDLWATESSSFIQSKEAPVIGMIVVAGMMILICVQTMYYFYSVPREGETLFYYEEAGLPMSGGNGYGEYEPTEFNDIKIGYNIWQLQEALGNATGATEIVEFLKYGTDSVLTANNMTAEEQSVYLPILYYPGYVAFDIFSNEPITSYKTDKGTLGVILPAGYMSAVKIEYHISWVYRVGELITFITAVVLGWKLWKSRRSVVREKTV